MATPEQPTNSPQQLQQKYERWHSLYKKQLEAQEQWLEAEALKQELQAYYLDEKWMADREADLPIDYSGEAHSIFSEDALWNMLTEHDEVARKWIRLGIDALDNK
ncbi:DUF4298 domain-containing protein [Psychrobacter sp. FDAARGOS_221]|uniref:DUF4298 domain-containing protein n=1 Tax=Psychrobacter sp. FDAARGOS_221 TaxID=1975705 RepID=UPI000BB5820E|nr:DUF4298 domain-containing protein [Psychrobacter sp. FDAARGOS_221]PNK60292.1 DUF4298 domain-containing protein [Psychrobacter sp. FDAARGOS_221]